MVVLSLFEKDSRDFIFLTVKVRSLVAILLSFSFSLKYWHATVCKIYLNFAQAVLETEASNNIDDVIKWKLFPRYWPFVRGIHRSLVNSPHKGQWRGTLMFSLICTWINGWVNNREAGYLIRHRVNYDVIVILLEFCHGIHTYLSQWFCPGWLWNRGIE